MIHSFYKPVEQKRHVERTTSGFGMKLHGKRTSIIQALASFIAIRVPVGRQSCPIFRVVFLTIGIDDGIAFGLSEFRNISVDEFWHCKFGVGKTGKVAGFICIGKRHSPTSDSANRYDTSVTNYARQDSSPSTSLVFPSEFSSSTVCIPSIFF